ncbi:MAG TPA: ATPase [Rhizobiales bacterium]|nr:hypothetical protein BMS3Bbin10_00403 [bacterium BMS3Bbin10]HDO52768.1 ATPase [Hyphomicrobiales bacterium]
MARIGEERSRRVTDQELRREAARIFPKLANDAGFIERVSDPGGMPEPAFGIFTRRNQYRRKVQVVSEAVVTELMAKGLMAEANGRYMLSDEGLLWLRRHRAGAEPFLEQHQLRQSSHRDIRGVRRPVIVNDGESPLGWLRKRKDREGTPMVDSSQFEAGERLRMEFERAQLSPSVTSNWEGAAPSRRMRRAPPAGAAALSDEALSSRQRVVRALEAVGPELSGVLIDVCCHLVGLADTEKSRGWPQRSGKVILKIALTRLARHYGLDGAGETARSARTRMRHWGAEDFRPSLAKWQ